MASISESFEHKKIRDTKELLQQDARFELNSSNLTWRVGNLIGVCNGKDELIDATGLHIRILTNTLTRAERLRVREMAGMSNISKIKNHKKKTAAQAQVAMKVRRAISKDGMTSYDPRLQASCWHSHDEEDSQKSID